MVLQEVTLVLGGKEVVVVGTWSSIVQIAADRLGCSKDDVVFMMKKDGRLKEVYSTSSTGWKRLIERGLPVHVSVREAGKKRKSSQYNDNGRATPESQLSSSFDTPPRPSALKKSRSSDGSRGNNSRSRAAVERVSRGSTNNNNQMGDCSRMVYTQKEDVIMWEKFTTLLKSMRAPDPGYTREQKEWLFAEVAMQAFKGKRSATAMKSKLSERIGIAARNGQLSGDELSSRYEALFPRMFRNLSSNHASKRGGRQIPTDDTSSEEEDDVYINDVDDDSSDSSESEASPPPLGRLTSTSGSKAPATISNYNPFATPAAAPSRRALPSWSKEGQALRRAGLDPVPPFPTIPLANPAKSKSVSSSGIGQEPSNDNSLESDRFSCTTLLSDALNEGAGTCVSRSVLQSAAQTDVPSNGISTTSTTAPPFVSPAPPLTSQVDSMNLGEATPQEKGQETGHDTHDAIVIKDESEDELIDEIIAVSSNIQHTANRMITAPARAGSVKDEHSGAREAVRNSLAPIFPIDGIFTLPATDWALSLASRVKTDALRGVTEPASRLEVLVACLDEFFYFSYHKVNTDYSVQRASNAIALLLLDLYHAFGDVEEIQAALVEIFYTRIFSKDAPKPGAAQAWMAYDLCAAVSIIFPCRPTWLLTLILYRCRHLRIEEVPPPADEVSLTFARLQALLDKLSSCQAFCEREPRIKLLCKSVHRPYIDSETLSNLQAFNRQTRSRLPASARAAIETTLAKIDQLNKEADAREEQRKAEEERFFADQLLLLSSPFPISIAAVEEVIESYSLQSQIRNGPMRKKFDSTRETWHLWILQFKSQERKQNAIVKLRDRPPNQEVQLLENCEQTHSMCPSLGQEEQQKWHRLQCDLHLHREYHRRCINRIKKEVKKEAPAPVPL